METDENYYSGFYIIDYAMCYKDLILKDILNLNIECYVNMFIKREDKMKAIREITEYIGIGEVEKKDTQEEIDILSSVVKDAREIRKKLQLEKDELNSICMYILVKAKTKEELDYSLTIIKEKLFLSGMIVKKSNYRQKELFEVSLPLNNNKNILSEISSRNILTSNLAGFYPFVSKGIYDYKGILIGKEKFMNSVVLIDRFDRNKYKNGNMCIFGSSGSGKSYFTKLQIIRERLYNKYQFILDPEREYKTVCDALNGTYIKFGKGTKTFINILDIKIDKKINKLNLEKIKEQIAYKLDDLKIFFLSIFENISKEEYLYFEKKMQLLYLEFLRNEKTLLLEDVQYMIKMDKKLKRYTSLLNPFTNGVLSFFNKKTNINLENKLIVVDLHDMEGENLKYGLFLFLDFFWKIIKKERKNKKIIYIDEIWKLIGASATKETAQYIYKLFKTIRKYNGAAVAITQDISDLFSIDDGKCGLTILNNSAFKSVFSLDDENINKLNKYLYISKNEKILIRGLRKGESFIQAEKDKMVIEIKSSKKEKQIIKGEKIE